MANRRASRNFALMLGVAGLAAGLSVASTRADDATVQTNPGFKPSTGQINPGVEHPAPSSSTDIRQIPTPAEARAALGAPDDPNPVAGPQVTQSPSSGGSVDKPKESTSADPTTATGGLAASGGAMSPGAMSQAASTGAGPSKGTDDVRPGPIGATGQTMPAKFSERNDTLDRLPIMAWPSRLSDEDRQKIYQAVMADKSKPTADAETLTPAGELSTDQALNGTHALPESLSGIAAVKGLVFLKTKDKVLLVTPATRTVVDEITS